MRPQVKSTIVLSVLGLSLALNTALLIGYLRGEETQSRPPIAHRIEDDYCLLDRLELDNDQQRRLAKMRRKMHEKRAAYWQRATAIKAELTEAISAAGADRAALEAQLRSYAENQAMMQRAVAEHLLGVNTMLRPEQRDAFRTLLRTEMFRGIRPNRSESAGAP
jgi:Spy/CpxP family protein refolding chaperone